MTVRIEKKGKVWTVIHSRAEARNAMDPESADALVAAFQEFDKNPEAAVAVLWGEGGAFCAGWDLKYCATMVQDAKQLHQIDYPLDDRKAIPRGPLGPTRLELDKPVIAAVAGPAVAGGFELALWCDLRVMEKSAYFGVYCRRCALRLGQRQAWRLQRHLTSSSTRFSRRFVGRLPLRQLAQHRFALRLAHSAPARDLVERAAAAKAQAVLRIHLADLDAGRLQRYSSRISSAPSSTCSPAA